MDFYVMKEEQITTTLFALKDSIAQVIIRLFLALLEVTVLVDLKIQLNALLDIINLISSNHLV